MKEYKNIEKVNTLDDGTLNVFMKNGKKAIVEIIRLNEKFQASVYSLFAPDFDENGEKDSLLKKLEKHGAYKECARDALGWIDENPLEFIELEEIKEFK